VKRGRTGFTLVEIMIVVSIIGVLAVIGIPSFARARRTAQKQVCVGNMRQISGAKQQWALENFQSSDATPSSAEVGVYLKGGASKCYCPADASRSFGSSYDIKSVAEDPACKIAATTHIAE
jgi:prepilin-type N-terminal cleavage/methylation domain-containing protein